MQRAMKAKAAIQADRGVRALEVDVPVGEYIDQLKRSAYGFSLRALLLYAQCGNDRNRVPGLLILDRGAAFGVGVFERQDGVHAHIVAPSGPNWPAAVTELTGWLLRKELVNRVYVRHLNSDQAATLRTLGFRSIEHYPWLHQAPSEDETFNHRRVRLSDILEGVEDSDCRIKTLDGPESKNFRHKFRLAYSRFENFLARSRVGFELTPMTPGDYRLARRLVHSHFTHLERANKSIGSTALDYELLLRNPIPHGPQYLSLMGWLKGPKTAVPASVFLGEEIAPGVGALYATITTRDMNALSGLGVADTSGFSAISQYAFARVFESASNNGWQHIDLGGSETADLDKFKRQMGGRYRPTTWVVCTSGDVRRLVTGISPRATFA